MAFLLYHKNYFRTVKSGRFPEIKEVLFDQNQQIYNVLFGDSNDVEVGNPIRRYENCFHGQAEFVGRVRKNFNVFCKTGDF